jgi:hypothetical protein
VWATGCIVAEMLGRKPLFPGHDYIHQLNVSIVFCGIFAFYFLFLSVDIGCRWYPDRGGRFRIRHQPEGAAFPTEEGGVIFVCV